jgi:glutamate N-acetyltransferase / amino-acid N-acetyltransferase
MIYPDELMDIAGSRSALTPAKNRRTSHGCGWTYQPEGVFLYLLLAFLRHWPSYTPFGMKSKIKTISGSITAPQGFLAAGVFCDIKRLGTGKGSDKGHKRDLALIVSEVPATAAGLFTTNQVCAAPVKVCLAHLKKRRAQAIVANSGNANACTGSQGIKDATAMAEEVSRHLHIPVTEIMVASTGRIGVPLPMARVKKGIQSAAALLGDGLEHAAESAEAIMTSDTMPKQIAVEITLGGKPVRLGGICKGAGMIQPGMSVTGRRPAAAPASGLHATMLCFLATDAAIEARTLQTCLQTAVAQSFNRITVDGDMSTNDTVLILANGLAENPVMQNRASTRGRSARSQAHSPDLRLFQEALDHVCLALAKMMVRDGEGVTRFVTVRVQGAKNALEAEAAARAIANSALVKTSWYGGDPNWGRIMGALGYSAATVKEDKVDIAYSNPGSRSLLYALKRGQPVTASYKSLCRMVAAKEFDLHVFLHLGSASTIVYAGDLTEAYVDFNKGSVGDPASMGG